MVARAAARRPEVTETAADMRRCLTALGDPTRQHILVLLSKGRLNVGQLTQHFQLSRPAISHQLKVLTDAGLLVQERAGREHVYRVDVQHCRAFVDRLRDFVLACCRNTTCC